MISILEFIKKYSILILIILGILLYFPSLFYDILNYDDMPFIIKNQYINGRVFVNFFDFFKPNLVDEAVYTPFTSTIPWLIIKLFGISSFVFHFVNVFFYILSSIVLYYLLKKIIKNDLISFFAVILYIIHPCHIENTVWISAMGYNIALLFFFLSFLYFISAFDENKKLNYFYSVIFYILAILSQPIAVTLPAILFLWVYCFRKERLKEFFILIFSYIPFLLFYLFLYSKTILQTTRFVFFKYTIFEKLSILGFDIFNSFIPIHLCPIQPKPNFFYIIYFVIFILLFVYFIKNKIVSFFIGFYIISLLPYSNLFFSIQKPVADRYLLLSSVSSCVLISVFMYWLYKKLEDKNLLKNTCILFLILLYFGNFLSYISIWKNDRNLWLYAYNINPNNIDISYAFGKLLISDKKYDEALILSEKMIRDNNLSYAGYKLKIKILMDQNLQGDALNFCLKVRDIFPKTYDTYLYLFDIYMAFQEYDKAESFLNIAIKICDKYDSLKNEKVDFFVSRQLILFFVNADADNYIENLQIISNDFKLLKDNGEFCNILYKNDYTSREEICLNYLKKYNNTNYSQSIIQLLSCLYMQEHYRENASEIMRELLKDMNQAQEFINKGDISSAEKMYLEVISKNKYMYEAYYNLGILYLQTNRQEMAKDIFSQMLNINPNDEQTKQILVNLGD